MHPPLKQQQTVGYSRVFCATKACMALLFMLTGCIQAGLPRQEGQLAVPLSPLAVQGGGMVMVVPQTLDDLIDKAPLILIGEVGPVIQYLEYAVYGEDGQLMEPGKDPAGNPLPPAPATDFALLVEEVIRDDGTVASGEPIILRMGGTATEEMKGLTKAGDYPFSYTGDRHLFLLASNPDGKSYGFYYGPWSRLLIDGEILRISNGAQQPLQFAGDAGPVTLDELVQQIKSE